MKGRRILRAAVVALVVALPVTALYGWWETRRAPIVRKATLPFPCCGTADRPMRLLFLSDIHVESLGFSHRRLARIVAQANALRPDLVLLGGDFVGGPVQHGKVPVGPALAPLARLRATFGTVAVLGNHDHSASPAKVREALRQTGITVLDNRAVRRGPLVIGGVDDEFTQHADLPRTIAAMQALQGPSLLLSHGPDVLHGLPANHALVLAGHTHCGQVVLPFVGALIVPSRHGGHYVCGLYRQRGNTLLVTAGTGFSEIPVRVGAPPDMWVIELVPDPGTHRAS